MTETKMLAIGVGGGLLLFGIVGTFAAVSQEETRVEVSCVNPMPVLAFHDDSDNSQIGNFVCTVKHVQGSSDAEACWRVNVTCMDGKSTSAKACQTVRAGESAIRVLPAKAFQPKHAECIGVAGTVIDQLVVK